MSLSSNERIAHPSVTDVDGRTVVVTVGGAGAADTTGDAGATAAAPAANTTIATLGDLPDGVYDVEVTTYQSGTPDANRENAELRNGASTLGSLLTTSTPTTARFRRVTMTGANQLLVRTGATIGGAGAVYVAQITATRVE